MYLFRYTDAFSPYDYVDLGDASAASVKFLFAEFDDENDVTPNSAGTLTINDTAAVSTIPADETDFVSASFMNASPAGVADRFDFRNIDFSPGVYASDAAGTNTGVVTGDNIDLGPQSRVVTLFIHSDDVPGAISSADMLVITKKAGPGEGDALTDPAFGDPFDCVYSPANLDGWNSGALNLLFGLPSNGRRSTSFINQSANLSGFTNSPNIGFNTPTLSSGGTTALTISSNAAQIGFANWSIGGGTAGTSTNNTLYRLRSALLSSNAATQETVRVGLSDGFTTAHAGYSASSPVVNPHLNTTATDFYTYMFSKQTGANLTITIDLIDQSTAATFTGTSSDEWTLSGVELCQADRADLGSGTQVMNFGGNPGTVASGQAVSPAASPTAFNTASNFSGGLTLNAARPSTLLSTGTTRGVTYGTIASPDPLDPFTDFYSTGYLNAFAANEGSLYALDVWISTSNAAAPDLPIARATVSVGQYYAHTSTNLSPTVLSVANNGAATTQAKVYSNFFEPQYHSGTPASSNANVTVDLLETINNIPAGTTVTIHQVTVTEWAP